MDFIKILGDVITEQLTVKSGATPIGGAPSSGAAGVTAGSNDAQSNSTTSGWSRVSSHSWKSGSKIESPLKNPGKCNNYGQNRGSGRGYHNACDISTKVGTSLFAPHDGTFTKVDNGVCGNGIIIIKGNDKNGKELHSGSVTLGVVKYLLMVKSPKVITLVLLEGVKVTQVQVELQVLTYTGHLKLVVDQ